MYVYLKLQFMAILTVIVESARLPDDIYIFAPLLQKKELARGDGIYFKGAHTL